MALIALDMYVKIRFNIYAIGVTHNLVADRNMIIRICFYNETLSLRLRYSENIEGICTLSKPTIQSLTHPWLFDIRERGQSNV